MSYPRWPQRAAAVAIAAGVAASCASLLDVDDLHYDDGAASTETGSATTGAGPAGDGGAGASVAGSGGVGGPGSGGGMAGAGGSCAPAPGGGGSPSSGTGGFAQCVPTTASAAVEFAGCPSCAIDVTSASASDGFEGDLASFCTIERAADPDGALVVAAGELEIVTSCSAWNTTGFGPFVYRRVTGDFAVVTQVTVGNGVGGDPSAGFHGAGLLLRAAKSPPGGSEDHLLFSMGHLASKLGGGLWATTAAVTDTITLPGATAAPHRLGVCRVGGDFHFVLYDGQWFEVDSSPLTHAELSGRAELEVGVTAHAYSGGQLVDAEFDFLNFGEVIDGDCLAAAAALGAEPPPPR